MDNTTIIAIIAFLGLLAVGLYLREEGYERACLGGSCAGMQRTPVDYAQKEGGWQQNPHYIAHPQDRHQPLDMGPVDLFEESRQIQHGTVFDQYRQDWEGKGIQTFEIANDEKNRWNLVDIGALDERRQLDDMYHPRFGEKGVVHTETTYLNPSDRDKTYGGSQYLQFGRLL